MSVLQYWLWLSGARVSPKSKTLLLKKYASAEAAFFAPDGDFAGIEGVSRADAAELERRDISRCLRIEETCYKQGISMICLQDADYPKRLKNIYAPPPVLYVKGKLPAIDDSPVIAVIGTRHASQYGLKMGRELARQICDCGATVVSGLTAGIDAEAARGALLSNGRCIGVLGTAHEAEKGRLAAEVAERGALISEYPPGTEQMKSFFRERNRISAGISVGVVVVEAPEKSGTKLFVAEAAEQGKEIFAVPGKADDINCAGTNIMLKEGAKLVTCGWDVVSEFERLYPDKIKNIRTAAPDEPRSAQLDKKSVDKAQTGEYIDLRKQLSKLSEDQLKIITAIEGNACHIDDIVDASGLPAAKVLSQLTILELKGYVRREAGRRISLNITKK